MTLAVRQAKLGGSASSRASLLDGLEVKRKTRRDSGDEALPLLCCHVRAVPDSSRWDPVPRKASSVPTQTAAGEQK